MAVLSGAVPYRVQQLARLARLPRDVRRFLRAAEAHARQVGDEFSLARASRPGDLATLLTLARGRRTVVELGTATGWAACALALSDPDRRVVTVDPVVREHRAAYLALAGAAAGRIDPRRTTGAEAADLGPGGVELLFVASSHDRADTLAELEAWRPRLAPRAVVVLDDVGDPDHPGVARAIADLGLRGRTIGALFVTTFEDRAEP